MARPKTLTTNRVKPMGDAKLGRTNYGLVFTRIAGVRRARAFPAAPRTVLALQSPEEYREAQYQIWVAQWGGTRPEWIVFDYLERRLHMVFGVEFMYQSSRFGGRNRIGGSVVDFELPLRHLFWRVQGERFHREPNVVASDILRATVLERIGFKVIDLWAEQLIQAPSRVIEAALRGIQLRRAIEP